MLIKILLAGDGGQGVQLMADVLCVAAVEKGWEVSAIPNFGLEQRGGVSLMFIQISDQPIGYPKFTEPDILAILSEQAEERTKMKDKRLKIKDYEKDIKILNIKYYKDILEQNKIPNKCINIFLLGMLTKILGEKKILTKEKVLTILKKRLAKKPFWEENERAFGTGYGYNALF